MNRDRRNGIRSFLALGFWVALLVIAIVAERA
jgi:hypothetical protein